MKLLELLGVFGGLALFLHGMQMMSSGLEAAAGNRMKTILERLTANRFMGILFRHTRWYFQFSAQVPALFKSMFPDCLQAGGQ